LEDTFEPLTLNLGYSYRFFQLGDLFSEPCNLLSFWGLKIRPYSTTMARAKRSPASKMDLLLLTSADPLIFVHQEGLPSG
jgi:hypothetical protein